MNPTAAEKTAEANEFFTNASAALNLQAVLTARLSLNPDGNQKDNAKEIEEQIIALLTGGPDKVLRCAFCGLPYPEGTPTHKHEALTAHVRVCTAHPIGKENRELRALLAEVRDKCPADPDCTKPWHEVWKKIVGAI